MGGKIGISIGEDDKLDLALDLMKKAKEKGVNLVLAVDAKIADAFSDDANTKFCAVDEIPDGWEGLDIGPKTEEIFANVIKESKTILWNGPTGVFEFDNFTHGSRAVGEAIVEATKNGAFSLVGGGDSVACVNKFGWLAVYLTFQPVVAHCSKQSKEKFFRVSLLFKNKIIVKIT